MMHKMQRLFLYGVIALSFCSVLYGVTYQQYRHFDVADPRGCNDSISYLQMSHGNYNVAPVHRYRFVIPVLAEYLRIPLNRFVHEGEALETLPFYIINFAFTFATSLLFLKLLQSIGFELWWAVLGVFVFLSSRVTIATTGCPLIDSFHLASMLLILLLTIREQSGYLALFMPLLSLSKETIVPFLLIPLLTKIRSSKCYMISLLASFGILYCARHVIDRTASVPSPGFYAIVQTHMESFWSNLASLFTLHGLHDAQHGFGLFLLFAVVGFYINCKHKLYSIPMILHLLVPISVFYALLSGNLGRMIFISFPAVIPYALIFIVFVYRQSFPQCAIETGPPHK